MQKKRTSLYHRLRKCADGAGVFHYDPNHHQLEKRIEISDQIWNQLNDHYGCKGFYVALSTIYWREAWKYGERAFRYCNLDIGHAIACLSVSANLFGWKVNYLNSVTSQELDQLLGFDKTTWHPGESEENELICFVHPPQSGNVPDDIPVGLIKEISQSDVVGGPNQLSDSHHDWNVIGEVSAATRSGNSDSKLIRYSDVPYFTEQQYDCNAAEIIRQRRSGQSYDGVTGIGAEQFFAMLDRVIPRDKIAPFDVSLGEISVNLLLFVHRVEGLDSGIYFLVRDGSNVDDIRKSFGDNFRMGTCG